MSNIFSQMDPEKLYSTQLEDLSRKGFVIPAKMFDTSAIDNYSASVTTAGQAMEAYGIKTQGAAGLLSNFQSIAATVGSTLLTMGASMLAMWAIGKIGGLIADGIDSIIHARENAIKAAEEAQEDIDTILDENKPIDEFQKGEKYQRAIELSSKITVSEDSYKNVSATNEEYEEYISICNEIAGIYPSIVSSYDAQGNAILNLGNNAEEATEKLDALYEKSQLAKYSDLKGKANETWAGNRYKLEDSATEQENARIEKEAYQSTIDLLNEANGESGLIAAMKELRKSGHIELDIGHMDYRQISDLQELLYNEAKKVGIELYINQSSAEPGKLITDILGTDFGDENVNAPGSLAGLDISAEENAWTQFYEELGYILPDVAADAENAIVEAGERYESATSETQEILKQQLDDTWEVLSVSPNFIKTLKGKDGIKQAIENSFMSITEEDLPDNTADIEDWAKKTFLDPITFAFNNVNGKEAAKAIENLFIDSLGNRKASDYATFVEENLKTVEQFYKSIGREDLYESFVINYDFGFKTPNGEIIYNDPDAVIRDIQDELAGKEKLTDKDRSKLKELTWDQLINVRTLLSDESYSGGLAKAINDSIAQVKEAMPEGTLADLFNDESYKESSEGYESKLSSLTSALETLRSEGELSKETMTELSMTFPELADNMTMDSLSDQAASEISSWVKLIRDAMDDMTPDQKNKAQAFIDNLIGSMGELSVSAKTAQKAVRDSLVSGYDYSSAYSVDERHAQEQHAEDVISALQERYGENLNWEIVWQLAVNDQLSGELNEIFANYNNRELNWRIELENQQLERDIETAQARIEAAQAARNLKEARGETLTEEDYHTETEALKSIAEKQQKEADNARTRYEGSYSLAALNTYNKEQAEADQAQADYLEAQRQEQEAGANETLKNLEDSNNRLSAIQNKISEAEKNGGKASEATYKELAKEQQNQADINNKLADVFQGLADTTANETWAQEWQKQANDYRAAAISAEAEVISNEAAPEQERYNKLQHESEQIQHELTVAEQKHQKVTKKTYQDLIANGQKQINSLRKQQDAVEDYGEDWWNLQSSIESMQDSIYDWSTTLDNLVVDQATNLASAISTAMQESMSDTGLTDETISSLVSGFSDVLGKDFDQSDMFYNTADGIKMNVEAVRELTQAEFDLQATNLADEIQRTQDALNAHPGNSALEEQLKSLMQTQAQFFAQYEEMQKALSYNALMDLAESTTNQGANFDANVERQKKYKEAWDEGWTGTDDFKAWTSYLDAWGRDTAEAYEAVSEKAARYFTEDATEGLGNFLEDLRSQGYATQDEEGFWDINVDDYDKAAQSMRMGSDWFMDMMTKLEEQDFTHTYVDSLTEAQLKTQDLDQQIQNAVDTYDRMVASGGATDDELQSQIETINGLTSEYRDLQQVTDTWGKVQEAKQKEEYLGMGDRLESLQTLYDSVDGEEAKEKVIEQARDLVESWGYTINEELARQGTIQLSAESAEDYAARTYVGSMEKPLTAEEMGIGPEVAGEYVAMQKKITGEYENQKELFESISQYSTDQLRDIDHADGAWSAGEQELENICDALGVSYDNADMLVNALASMGLIKAPELVDEIPDKIKQGKEAVQEFLDVVRGGPFKDMNLDADITEMGTEALDSRIDKLEALRRNFAEGSDEFEYLTGEIGKTEAQLSIQTKLEGGDTTLKQLKDIRDDKEAIAEAFNIDMNSEDAAAQIAAIQEQIDAMDLGYDMTVHIDEQQFADLMEGITGEPYEVEVGADTDPLTEGVETAKDKLSNETIELGVDTDSDGTDKIHGATTAIKEEGEAAEEAVPKKEEFAEANKQVAESAVNTEEATEGAGDGMLSEASASIDSMNKPLISGDLINKVANAAGDFAEDFVDRYNTALENEQTKRTLRNMSGEVIDGANEVGTLLGDTLNGIINNGKQHIENEQMKQEATDAIASVASDAADTADTVGQFLGDALKTAWDNGKKYIEEDTAQREEQKRAEEERKHNRDEIYSPESTSSYQSNQGKPHSAEDDHETHKIQTPTEEPVEITANEVNVGEGKESIGDYSKDAKDKAIEWLAGLTGDSVDEVSSKRGQSLLGDSNAEISRTGIYGGRSNGPIQNTGLEELNRAKTAQKELQEFFSSHEDTLQQVSTLYEEDAQKAQSYFD